MHIRDAQRGALLDDILAATPKATTAAYAVLCLLPVALLALIPNESVISSTVNADYPC